MKRKTSLVTAHRIALITVAAITLSASGAGARSSGISGYSGEDGLTCETCHTGGVAPDVEIDGPTTVAAGQTALFRFVVRSHGEQQIAAGFDVSATDGFLDTVPGTGAKVLPFAGLNEVTHTQPRYNDENGETSWPFTWKAPDAMGQQTLFAAGNSVDGFVDQDGDQSATTTFDVEVRCAGDCSDDELVSVDELVRGIEIALGGEPLDDCPLADGNGDGSVSISDLVAAVASAVNGCP